MKTPTIYVRHKGSPKVPLRTSNQIKIFSRKIAKEHMRVLGALLNAGYDIVDQINTEFRLVHIRKATALFLDMDLEELPKPVRGRVEKIVNSEFLSN